MFCGEVTGGVSRLQLFGVHVKSTGTAFNTRALLQKASITRDHYT